MLKHDKFKQMISDLLAHELSQVLDSLIIPMGKAVSEVLRYLVEQGLLDEKPCLFDFPHPSGANGHCKRQFEQGKEGFTCKIKERFNSRRQKANRQS